MKPSPEAASYGLRRARFCRRERGWRNRFPSTIAGASLKYSFDVYTLTRTARLDIPIYAVTPNIEFNGFPTARQPGAATPCNTDLTALCVPEHERVGYYQLDDWKSATASDADEFDILIWQLQPRSPSRHFARDVGC